MFVELEENDITVSEISKNAKRGFKKWVKKKVKAVVSRVWTKNPCQKTWLKIGWIGMYVAGNVTCTIACSEGGLPLMYACSSGLSYPYTKFRGAAMCTTFQ